MQRQIQHPIKHQDMELFAKIFNGSNPVNAFAKFSASRVWQSLEVLWETFNDITLNECMTFHEQQTLKGFNDVIWLMVTKMRLKMNET